MEKDGFVIYKSFYKPISRLSDNQLGRLLRALFEYNIKGDITVDDDIEMAFEFFRNQFEIDKAKYLKVIEKNRENGRRGGQQKAENKRSKQKKVGESADRFQLLPTATDRQYDLANLADKEKEKVKDKDYYNDNNSPPISPSGGESVSEAEKEFERFWELYDKKVGKAKAKAKFLKLSKTDKEKIFSTLKQYVENTPNPTYRKDPLTYLNGECWNDEIIPRDERQSQTPGNSRPVDHSQFRDPTRHYETVSDF